MKMRNIEYGVRYSPSSGDEDFASQRISRVNFFLIRANTKFSRAVGVNIRRIT